VVNAFNAIQWMRLRDDGRPAQDRERLGIPISGDDEQAKRTVAELIDQIGFDPVDAGTLAEGGASISPERPPTPKACAARSCAPASPTKRASRKRVPSTRQLVRRLAA
jgi:hypothetical protein